jgi:hypothetical protein
MTDSAVFFVSLGASLSQAAFATSVPPFVRQKSALMSVIFR